MLQRLATIVLFLLLAVAFVAWVVLPQPARKAAVLLSDTGEPLNYPEHIRPLLDQYCVGCHGERKRAGLDLRLFPTAESVRTNRDVFESVLKQVEGGLMPPDTKPQPSPAARRQITGWIRAELFYCDCSHPDPGRVTLRRLNRTEYNNTIHDLVGVDLQPANDFPDDDTGYGFDNIGDVLSLPPVLFERYLAAAGKVLDAAIVTEPRPPPRQRFAAGELTGGDQDNGNRVLASEGQMVAAAEFPADGEYQLRVRAFGDQAGGEPVRMALRLDGQDLARFDVRHRADAPEDFVTNVIAKAGHRLVEVAFLNDFSNPEAKDPQRRDRNLHVVHVEVSGPLTTNLPPLTAAHRRLLFAQPSTPTPAARRAAAKEVIDRFASRAFRRPVHALESDRLLSLYTTAVADGDSHEQAVKLAFQATLVSPHFLFREEPRRDPRNPQAIQPVDEFALASRLSYFLWSTMPDQELFELAERGKLRRNLPAQVRRMLKHPRARALTDNFAGQWLQIRNLDGMTPDPGVFPGWDDALRAAMHRETELFFERIRSEDRSVLEFLDADWTFANERLARHYGLAGVSGDDFRLVSLQGTPRGGLLTQGSILTVTSNPTRTSPVKRGKWVLDNILGTPPPPPPPNVPLLDEAKGAQLSGSLRQRMEQHRADPLCASCHALMDPIGFGFENFDGTGAWRQQDGGHPIDPAGQLVSGEAFQGPAELRRILLVAKREEFLRCLTAKLLTFALGRGVEYYDQCAIDEVVRQLGRKEYRFSALVLGVVNSAPFQLQRGEAPPTPPRSLARQ